MKSVTRRFVFDFFNDARILIPYTTPGTATDRDLYPTMNRRAEHNNFKKISTVLKMKSDPLEYTFSS